MNVQSRTISEGLRLDEYLEVLDEAG